MPTFKGINTESDPIYNTSAMCVQLRRHTLTASHLVDDDIDTCTMEEARNLNFCRMAIDMRVAAVQKRDPT